MLISTQQAQAVRASVNAAASGDNLLGHTVTAAALGAGFSATVVWLVQTFAHVVPPDSVDQWFTAVGIVAASWILQKASGQ